MCSQYIYKELPISYYIHFLYAQEHLRRACWKSRQYTSTYFHRPCNFTVPRDRLPHPTGHLARQRRLGELVRTCPYLSYCWCLESFPISWLKVYHFNRVPLEELAWYLRTPVHWAQSLAVSWIEPCVTAGPCGKNSSTVWHVLLRAPLSILLAEPSERAHSSAPLSFIALESVEVPSATSIASSASKDLLQQAATHAQPRPTHSGCIQSVTSCCQHREVPRKYLEVPGSSCLLFVVYLLLPRYFLVTSFLTSFLPYFLPSLLPSFLTSFLTYLLAYLPTCLLYFTLLYFTYVLTYLRTYVLTYLCTYLLTYLLLLLLLLFLLLLLYFTYVLTYLLTSATFLVILDGRLVLEFGHAKTPGVVPAHLQCKGCRKNMFLPPKDYLSHSAFLGCKCELNFWQRCIVI